MISELPSYCEATQIMQDQFVNLIKDNMFTPAHHSSPNPNMYVDFMKAENIQPSADAMGDTTITSIAVQISEAHKLIQSRFREYISAKNTLKNLEKCMMDIDEKIHALNGLAQQVETITFFNVSKVNLQSTMGPVVESLRMCIDKQRVKVSNAEEAVKALGPIIQMVGNPPDYQSIQYHSLYKL